VRRRQKLKGVKREIAFRGSSATMRKTMLAVLVTVAFSAVGVLGDYFLKLSSARATSPWGHGGFMSASLSMLRRLLGGYS
jgi:hypothetical protein